MKIFQSTARGKCKCCHGLKPSETEWISFLAKTPGLPEASFHPSLFILLLSCPGIGDAAVDLCWEEWNVLQGNGSYFCALSQMLLEMMTSEEGPSFGV